MIYKEDSTEIYEDGDLLVSDIKPFVEGITGALLRGHESHKPDCQQNLYLYAFESMTNPHRTLTFQHLVNKLWWRAVDFIRRDKSFNFWKKHTPITEVASNNSRYTNKLSYNADTKIDIDKLFKFAETILSERDHTIFLLTYEGFYYSDIGDIMGGYKPYLIRASATRTRKKMRRFMEEQDSTSTTLLL